MNFDRCANPYSLYPPQAAVVGIARAGFRRSDSEINIFPKIKQTPKGVCFCLAEKGRLELPRRLPDLRP